MPTLTRSFGRAARVRAVLAAVALTIALPTTAGAARAHPNQTPKVSLDPAVQAAGGVVIGLINSGQRFHGQTFEGLPDGLGIAPVGNARKFVDIYVAFEQSHVPFSGFADFQDSSVLRARLDINTKEIVGLVEVLPPEAGYIRFCSAFMAGPAEGFENYTFFVNEESDDIIDVVPGAQYGADASITPYRQAGYSVYLDTATGEYHQIAGLGRHNHENTVIVPGGWDDVIALSGDDTFNAPSSQLYMYGAADPAAFMADQGTLWAFQVTGVNGTPLLNPNDPQNNANDFLEVVEGNNYQGRFIEVPPDIARGTNPTLRPQAGLEAWSNDNNIFQFVRVEDIAYDPDHPRDVYFTDTGTTRLRQLANGRLGRWANSTDPANFPQFDSNGRVFKMVLNADDPTVVDSLSVYAEGRLVGKPDISTSIELEAGVGFLNPDNLDISANSMMVQEDGPSANDVWQNPVGTTSWMRVASTTQIATAETSGIIDASAWLGDGWWVLDVQSHVNLTEGPGGLQYVTPITGTVLNYNTRLEDGQLLLMYVPGS